MDAKLNDLRAAVSLVNDAELMYAYTQAGSPVARRHNHDESAIEACRHAWVQLDAVLLALRTEPEAPAPDRHAEFDEEVFLYERGHPRLDGGRDVRAASPSGTDCMAALEALPNWKLEG